MPDRTRASETIDVAVIGGGAAGLAAALAVGEEGKRALLVDPVGLDAPPRPPGGALGLRRMLRDLGRGIREARELRSFCTGMPERLEVERSRVMAHLRAQTSKAREEAEGIFAALPGLRRVRSEVEVLDVEGRVWLRAEGEVHAGAVVVATGGHAPLPEALLPVVDRVVRPETLTTLDEVPASLLVVGASPEGLEIGQAFARLGARVSVVASRSRVSSMRDGALDDRITARLAEEMRLFPGARLMGATPCGWGAKVRFRDREGREHDEAFESVLLAEGLTPNLDGLGLADLGILHEPGRPPPFDPETLRCGDAPVFLAGEVTGAAMPRHQRIEEGRIAGRNAAHLPARIPGRRSIPMEIVLTDPPQARVGALDGMQEAGLVVGESPLDPYRIQTLDPWGGGVVRLLATHEDRRLRGAEMSGRGVEHLAHQVAWAVGRELTVDEFVDLPVFRPSAEEALQVALLRLRNLLEARAKAA